MCFHFFWVNGVKFLSQMIALPSLILRLSFEVETISKSQLRKLETQRGYLRPDGE